MANGLVLMQALQFFTVNSPTNGAILHGDDREEADPIARYPEVSEKDAAFLEARGLAKPYNGRVQGGRPTEDGSGMTVDERSGFMTETNADAEDSTERTTGLATRDTTTFEKPIEELAGSGGANQPRMIADDGRSGPAAEDEAPAGGKAAAKSGGKAKSE